MCKSFCNIIKISDCHLEYFANYNCNHFRKVLEWLAIIGLHLINVPSYEFHFAS